MQKCQLVGDRGGTRERVDGAWEFAFVVVIVVVAVVVVVVEVVSSTW